MSNAETLINVFMTSRLHYCNALLDGCSARLINKLQVLSTLHWLPIKLPIDFNLILIHVWLYFRVLISQLREHILLI